MLLAGDTALGNRQAKADLEEHQVLCNLEGPVLTDPQEASPSAKAGPHLYSSGLPEVNGTIVAGLANNHTMDYGRAGLEQTITALKQAGYPYCGAGENLERAREPAVLEDMGVKVGVLAACEAQFGIADGKRPGVAALGPWVHDAIRRLAREVDSVVVSVHASSEMSPWPSPHVQALFRSFVKSGARVVHGHHSHVPRGFERHGGGIIFYGMGNFLVAPAPWRESANTLWSLVAEIDLASDPVDARVFPVEVEENEGTGLVLARKSSEQELDTRDAFLGAANRPLDDPDLLRGLWQETALRTFFHSYCKWLRLPCREAGRRSHAGWRLALKHEVRRLLRSMGGKRRGPEVAKDQYLLWYVLFTCMSHRDAIAEALGVLSGELPDLRTDETREMADEYMPWSRGIHLPGLH